MSGVQIFEFIIEFIYVALLYVFVIAGFVLIDKLDKILKEKDDIIRDLESENGFFKGFVKGLMKSEDDEDEDEESE